MNRERLFAESLDRLVAQHPCLEMRLDWTTAIAMVAHLQLALRHPGNRGESAGLIRTMLDDLFTQIERVEPTLAKLLRLGDNPQHDV